MRPLLLLLSAWLLALAAEAKDASVSAQMDAAAIMAERDDDRDGFMSMAELKKGFEKLNEERTNRGLDMNFTNAFLRAAQKAFDEADASKDAKLDDGELAHFFDIMEGARHDLMGGKAAFDEGKVDLRDHIDGETDWDMHATLDQNGDGFVTEKEFMQHEKGKWHEHPKKGWYQRHAPWHEDTGSAEESVVARSEFKRSDIDNNGKLDKHEFVILIHTMRERKEADFKHLYEIQHDDEL